MRRVVSSLLSPLLFVAPAMASDGVFEINHACATSSAGCFPGDAGGHPVTISASGSYRLTGNLTLSTNQIGIQVAGSQVDIDLGGFAISGPTECEPGSKTASVVCRNVSSSASAGVLGFGSGLRVHDGSITGLGSGISNNLGQATIENLSIASTSSDALDLGSLAIVTRVSIERSAGSAMYLGDDAEVTHCKVTASNTGISVGRNSLVSGNVVADNRYTAVTTPGDNTVIRGNVLARSGGTGISTISNGLVIEANAISEHTFGGILAGSAAIKGNVIRANGYHGINTIGMATVIENHVEGNELCGFRADAASPGQASTLANNSFVNNGSAGCAFAGANQVQVSGFVYATTCNVVSCTTGSSHRGVMCPPNTVTCEP